jgi:NADP-dependent 3-hydroxy acid dehydrogenase YdfG
MSFAGKTVVITGAGSGIGRATALAFARRGARIIACDVDATRLATLAPELGDRLLTTRCVDVANRQQMQAFANEVDDLDVLVNNAGVAFAGSFLDTSLDDWDWVLGINLRGVVHGCHFFLPKMIARRSGHIVNVSSILGIVPSINVSAYVASNFAVRGLSLVLRAELARHGIGVTAICPGMIATSIVDQARVVGKISTKKAKLVQAFHERGAPPSKVADAILAAVERNAATRLVGADARVAATLARFAPGAIGRLMSLGKRFGY